MLRQFFRTLPYELEEAAKHRRLQPPGDLVEIILPLSGPALSTLALITSFVDVISASVESAGPTAAARS